MPPQLTERITVAVSTKDYSPRKRWPLLTSKKGQLQDHHPTTTSTPPDDYSSLHVKDRTSSHLRKNQMKLADSRTLRFDEPELQDRQQVVVEIQLEMDQLIGKPGLVLERTRGTTLLLVNTIREKGWFTSTALRVGMAVLSVNGVPMAGRTPSKVIKALCQAQDEGKLSLVAGCYTKPETNKCPPEKDESNIAECGSIEVKLTKDNVAIEGSSSTTYNVPRYSRLHTIVTKKTKEDVFGITFRKNARDAPLIIKSFAKKGKFQGSELCPGMVVIQVNEKDATWMNPREAVEELQNAAPGEVSITTEGYTGKAFKAIAGDSLGLSVTSSSSREGVFIVGIDPASEFARSELRAGMQVILINGKPCPLKAEDAVDLLDGTEGEVTILATLAFLDGDNITVSDMTCDSEHDVHESMMNTIGADFQKDNLQSPRPEEEVMILRKLPTRRKTTDAMLSSHPIVSCFGGSMPKKDPRKQRSELVHISLQKELRKTKPGIVLSRKKDSLVVKEIRKDSWFSKTALEAGMVLLAVDNKSVVQKDVEHVFKLFQEARKSGRMLLTARKGENGIHQDQRLSRIQAIAYKKTPTAPIGITFSRADSTSPLVVKEISETGIMKGSMIQPGMVVLQINGRRASWLLSPAEASAAIRHAPVGRISITAEGFCGTAYKSRRNEGFGLIVKNSSSREGLFISHIKEDSPFAFSPLKPGMQILMINGKPCPSTLKATGKLLRKSGEKVEILATSAFQEGFKVTVDDLASRQEGPFLDSYFKCLVFDFD
ncbi:unnamed protein product [Cylindrotheca closterium]|uniref:PDZ domain-containing protein n=1 Tax=Cylindrotheca closterium TaxID=2856 RepID=A0AAD2FFR1_9STRA|nr:unnamed protein product [Cylindrotheca closterium]